MIRAYCLLVPGVFALSACATTTSFAPAPVTVKYGDDFAGEGSCPSIGRRVNVTVDRNVVGTFKLVDAFITAYRCSAHAAANGRQVFELPAFLATTGAAVAGALGGGVNYGIAGTSANALFNAGKGYYDPKVKAAVYDHALDALLCIKTEAVGVNHFALQEVAKEDREDEAMAVAAAAKGIAPPASVLLPADAQYFMMVSAAAFSVERVLAQRLSNVGSIDASSVAAQIEALAKEIEEKKKAKENPPPDPTEDKAFMAMTTEQRLEAAQRKMVELDLAELQPELQKCVTYAKL